jgi:hypothetical protein
MCTLVATNLRNPDCGHRLVDCLYTSPRHATCEYSSHYQACHRIKILSPWSKITEEETEIFEDVMGGGGGRVIPTPPPHTPISYFKLLRSPGAIPRNRFLGALKFKNTVSVQKYRLSRYAL